MIPPFNGPLSDVDFAHIAHVWSLKGNLFQRLVFLFTGYIAVDREEFKEYTAAKRVCHALVDYTDGLGVSLGDDLMEKYVKDDLHVVVVQAIGEAQNRLRQWALLSGRKPKDPFHGVARINAAPPANVVPLPLKEGSVEGG